MPFFYEHKLLCRVLCTKEVLIRHTAENIASVLSSIFNEWEISDKIVAIASDDRLSIKCAVKEKCHQNNHPCIAHTLNLIAKGDLTENPTLKAIHKMPSTSFSLKT